MELSPTNFALSSFCLDRLYDRETKGERTASGPLDECHPRWTAARGVGKEHTVSLSRRNGDSATALVGHLQTVCLRSPRAQKHRARCTHTDTDNSKPQAALSSLPFSPQVQLTAGRKSMCHNSMAVSTKSYRLGPRLYRRGLHGQPKIFVKTKLGTQGVSKFTVDNTIQCPKTNGYGELPEELGQEALDNFFDTRQGKAESILDYIFREEILTVALKKDTAIDLDEKIRGYWLMRTSNLTEREISGIKIITHFQTHLAQVEKAITQTIVAKKSEDVRKDLREAGDRARDRPGGYPEAPNLHLDGDIDDDQEDRISESESNCSEQWNELDGQEQEALISLRDARKKLQHATKTRKFYPKGGGRAKSTKARLCVLGFQDAEKTEVPRDSPTLSAASEALIMHWVASHKCRLISGDIKTAFLSGDEDIRNIFISPT